MNVGSIADRSPKVRAFIIGETAPLKSMPSYETDLSAVGDRAITPSWAEVGYSSIAARAKYPRPVELIVLYG